MSRTPTPPPPYSSPLKGEEIYEFSILSSGGRRLNVQYVNLGKLYYIRVRNARLLTTSLTPTLILPPQGGGNFVYILPLRGRKLSKIFKDGFYINYLNIFLDIFIFFYFLLEFIRTDSRYNYQFFLRFFRKLLGIFFDKIR